MRFRPYALLVSLLLSACALPGGAAPTPQASAPTAAPAATAPAASAATSVPAPTAAPDTNATSAPAQPGTAANYERADCKFTKPDGIDVACGFLTVPENRAKGGTKTIRLHVGVFKSKSATPKPDPIVYLEGGPGGNALDNWAENIDRSFGPFLAERDIVIFDQRGTGHSEPSLACPEYTKEAFAQLDTQVSVNDSLQRYTGAIVACGQRLQQQGVDLSAYNSVESAADLAEMRVALGYKEWNVYGISYGTRLALTTMRDHPEGVRSVVIDSVVPLQSGETDTPANIDHAFTTFFQGCAKSPACNSAYPNLEATFYKLIDTLNAKPVMQEVNDPTDNKPYKVLLTGDAVLGGLIFSLYQTTIIPLMPRAIAAAANGSDYSLLARLDYFSTKQTEDISFGMFYAVRCNEEYPFETPEAFQTADDKFPRQRGLVDESSFVPICTAFNAGKAPAVENQPVTSDLPTLVLAGEYDPATPPDDSALAAKTLSKSFFFKFPGYGHGESIDGDCATDITQAFFEDPTTEPDSVCIANLNGPDFAVPEGPIKLKAFEDTETSVKGVVPDGWKKAGSGAYANSSGDAVILQFAAPRSQAETLSRLKQQFKLADDPKAAGDHTSSIGKWTLYTLDVQGEPAELALLESGGSTLVVLVASPKERQQELHDALFIPALDALQPLK